MLADHASNNLYLLRFENGGCMLDYITAIQYTFT